MSQFHVRRQTTLFILIASWLLSAAAAAQTPPQQGTPQDMLAAVNAARAAENLTPLTLENRLNAAACRQARDLAGRALHDVESLSHRGSDGSDLAARLRDAGYGFRTAAENLAAGVADPAETVRLWLDSEGHRRNLLGAFRAAGAAHLGPTLSPGGNRRGPMDVWVLVLATPSGPSPSPAADSRAAKNPNDCAG